MLNRAEAGRRLSIAVLVAVLFVGLSAAFDAGTDAISRQALAKRGECTTAQLVGSSVVYGKTLRDKYTFVAGKKNKKHTTYYEHPLRDANANANANANSNSNPNTASTGSSVSAPTIPVWYLPDNPNVCRVSVSGFRPSIAEEEAQYAFATAAAYLIVAGLAAFVLKNYAGPVSKN